MGTVLRRLIFQLIRGVILIAREVWRVRRAICAILYNYLASVELPAFAVSRERRLHDPLAQWPILQRAERRLAGCVLHSDNETCLPCVSSFAAVAAAAISLSDNPPVLPCDRSRSMKRSFPSAHPARMCVCRVASSAFIALSFSLSASDSLRARVDEILVVALEQVLDSGSSPSLSRLIV